MMKEEAERLRRELAACRQAKGFSKYPARLRNEAVHYVRVRRAHEASLSALSKELGVAFSTVESWVKSAGVNSDVGSSSVDRKADAQKLSLVPVVIREHQGQHRTVSWLEVDFIDGTRLQATGITTTDLARAIEALRRPT